MIEIKNMFYRNIFNDVNVVFGSRKNLIYGINGSGKTTLLKLIVGVINPDSGSIKIKGKLALLPQEFYSPFSYRVHEILRIKMPYIDTSIASSWLEKAGISKNRFFSTLSGGEKRKVLLVKLLLKEADIYLLDEPQEFLDENGIEFLRSAIDYLAKKNKHIIITTAMKDFFKDSMDVFEIKNRKVEKLYKEVV